MQLYEEHLKSFNTSPSFQRLLQEKIGSEEIVLTTKCQFTKVPAIIPIRHSQINYVHCLFDFDAWMELFKEMQNKVEPTGFACPGCKRYTNFKDYGVDYNFYHILEELRLFKQKNPNLQLNDSQLIYQPSKNMYFVEQKLMKPNNNLNAKIKVIPQRYLLPGCVSVFGVSKKQQKINITYKNEEQKRILEELSLTIVKLQQLLFSKLYKTHKGNKKVPLKDLQDKVAQKKQMLSSALSQSLKLISLGARSLNDDYIFALKKIYANNTVYSIVKMHHNLKVNCLFSPLWNLGLPYVQLEQALYIKGESNQNQNVIYVIGGQKPERFNQSNQCLQITFPKNPFQQGEENAIITQLPDFPLEGYNFMGTSYKGNLYVFYGQRQMKNQDNQIISQLLNCQYVLRNNRKWEQLQTNLVQRYDGSFFTIHHQQYDKLIVFYGGITQDPDGVPNHRCSQQFQGQMFICRDEQFLGVNQKCFNISHAENEQYRTSVLASPVFSCPYYGTNQLILSGECLKYKNIDKREIYTFDWAIAVVKQNELFSLEPPEQIFTPYRRRTATFDIFSPVQDPQGAIAYGCFYVIHQYEVESSVNERQPKILTQLLKINLTNGLFFSLPYQDSQTSRQNAQRYFQNLEDRQNIQIQ